jgi:predicted acetyltransferase
MNEILLISPEPEHRAMAEEFKREFFDCGETVINGSALLDRMEYPDWLEHIRRAQNPETAGPDWVVADTFLACRKSDGKLVGIIDIRHSLDNAFLAAYGGHIGYSVRPGERRKGYAASMLRQALTYSISLGLSAVMLGCYADNLASQKTIEKCGGVLTETKPYLDGKPMLIYWIKL